MNNKFRINKNICLNLLRVSSFLSLIALYYFTQVTWIDVAATSIDGINHSIQAVEH